MAKQQQQAQAQAQAQQPEKEQTPIMSTPHKAKSREGEETTQTNFLSRAINVFRTPASKTSALHNTTPPTVAMTPEHHRGASDEGYLGEHEEYRIRKLFRDELHLQPPRSSSNRRSRRLNKASSSSQQSFDSGGGGSVLRRKSSRPRSFRSPDSFSDITPATSSSTDHTSSDSSPDRPKRKKRGESMVFDEALTKKAKFGIQIPRLLLSLLGMVLLSVAMMCWSNQSMDDELLVQYERTIRHAQHKHHHNTATLSNAGLRGKLVQMAGDPNRQLFTPIENDIYQQRSTKNNKGKKTKGKNKGLQFSPPPPLYHGNDDLSFEEQDESMYDSKITDLAQQRVFFFGSQPRSVVRKHDPLTVFPADFTDTTQYYGLFDSDDEHLERMEMRQPLSDGECVPMQDWQTTYHPSCNAMHELGMEQMGDEATGDDFELFGTKGFWRNAWRMDSIGGSSTLAERESIVLKTLKYQHSFEDAHFEHDRVDAVAMERLTASPHVINVFGFCGHSVMTEFADGSRVGELADKSKSKPLARLKIARDIANGLADVHGIDGDGNATFVHLDINPANVVSVGGTLKLNDFNIGILLRWNTTSNTQCGFPAQYPNPQWRSPEEARSEQNLSEKVDIFSMGHIFFRLICGHEPWNKLEKEGKPTKEEIHEKVKKGILPNIPTDVLTSTDREVSAIRDVMIACYSPKPKDRPSAREIASILQVTLESLEKQPTAEK